MAPAKWFDRQFDFSLVAQEYDMVCERLRLTPAKLERLISGLSPDILVYKPEGKWSIKEHAGHLCLLESLWQQRIQDIQNSKPVLTPADLENKATSEAGFNSWDTTELIKAFAAKRNNTILLLIGLAEGDKNKTSLHPRLQQPMRIIDHAYFAAEHDDHHLDRIREIVRLF